MTTDPEFEARQEKARIEHLYHGKTAEQAGYWPPGPDTGYPRDYPRADGSPSGYEMQRRDFEADDR